MPVSIRGVTDPDGDPVAVTITGVRQDEPLQGSVNASGIGTPSVSVRAEREGKETDGFITSACHDLTRAVSRV